MSSTVRPDPMADDDEFAAPTQAPAPSAGVSAARSGQGGAGGKLGPLLDERNEAKVADTIVQLVREQAKARRRRRVFAKANEYRLQGCVGVQVKPSREDVTEVALSVPLGAFSVEPVMNRAEELIGRVVAHLLADAPEPDAEPADDSEMEREAAETTTRILKVEGAESGFNLLGALEAAAHASAVYRSGFLYLCIDPAGNGWRAMEVLAHPAAPHKDVASIDPATGYPVASDDQLTTRYVRADGSLTDDPNEAERQWLPKLRVEVLTPESVVLVPATCEGVGDALGAIVIQWPTVADARAKFPALAKLPPPALRALVDWNPAELKHAKPQDAEQSTRSRADASGSGTAGGAVSDSDRICTLSLYFRSHGAYPKGAYVVVSGTRVLHRQPWTAMVERTRKAAPAGAAGDPAAAPTILVEECLDVPLAQVRLQRDHVGRDHMGKDFVAPFLALDERRGRIVRAWEEYLDRFTRPITWIPLGSIVTADDVETARETGAPLYFNPQGKPEQERAEAFPPDGKEFFDRTTEAGNDLSALQETAQGGESPNSQSGTAKAIVVQQVQRSMSSMRSGVADACERFWRVATQLFRGFYTVPQQAQYLGEDGEWRRRLWSRADLGSTRHIKIAMGSFTQLSPQQKQDMALQLMGVVDPATGKPFLDADEAKRIITGGLRPTLGLKENPHVKRAKRQLAKWADGPPAGFAEQDAQFQQALVQQQMEQQAMAAEAEAAGQPGQPASAAPPPPPHPASPFERRPVDLIPAVAEVRFFELQRQMAEDSYLKQPPAWRALYDAEFEAMRQAAGVQTVAEQQQAAQQAAEQAAAQQAGEADAQRGADAEKADADRSHDLTKQREAGGQRMAELALQGEQGMAVEQSRQRAAAMTQAGA